MLVDANGQSDIVYNDSMQQIAVNVGIFGAICGFITSLFSNAVVAIQAFTPSLPDSSFYIQLDVVNLFSLIFSFLASVGFVGIFSLKGSRLGFFFPLKTLAGYFLLPIMSILLVDINQNQFSLFLNLLSILQYILAILGVLVLLSIRKKSCNPRFLLLYIVFILIQTHFWYLLWPVIVGIPILLNGSFLYLLSSFLTVLFSFIGLYLLLTFFSIERKRVFIEANPSQVDRYH